MTKVKLIDKFTEKHPYLNRFESGENDLKLILRLIKEDEKLNKRGRERFGDDWVDCHPHSKILRLFAKIYKNQPKFISMRHTISDFCKIEPEDSENVSKSIIKRALNLTNARYFVPLDFMRACRAAHQSYDKIDTKFIEKVKAEYCGESYYFFEIDATLKLWKQIDTYKKDTVTLSTSTMHNILDRPLFFSDFEGLIDGESLGDLNHRIHILKDKEAWKKYKSYVKKELNIEVAKLEFENALTDMMPINYIQKRFLFATKKTLQWMIMQRENHKLKGWHVITDELERCLNEE